MNRKHPEFIMAIFPNTRGFAYVVFEGPLSPVDWGISDVRGRERNRQCARRISALIEAHRPYALALRDEDNNARRGRALRVCKLVEKIEQVARSKDIVVAKISRNQIRGSFEFLREPTRDAIVMAVARLIPLFATYVPPVRKIWKSEDRRMALFDAAALALSFYRLNPTLSSQSLPAESAL